MEYIGMVDVNGILFVYKDSEALRNQIQKGIVEEKFLFSKKADESFEKPKKGFNIFKVRIKEE